MHLSAMRSGACGNRLILLHRGYDKERGSSRGRSPPRIKISCASKNTRHKGGYFYWCGRRDLNPHVYGWTQAPQACLSTNSSTPASASAKAIITESVLLSSPFLWIVRRGRVREKEMPANPGRALFRIDRGARQGRRSARRSTAGGRRRRSASGGGSGASDRRDSRGARRTTRERGAAAASA